MTGPLHGLRVVELAGIGPGPFAAYMLSDLGADVIRVDRAASSGAPGVSAIGNPTDVLGRGRRSIAVDLKRPEGVEVVLRLVASADACIDPFRPNVAERLGIGPDECLRRNPRLVYGRMTGWGQDGPYADVAGHDIDYIALAGALFHFGREGDAPVFPLNLVGDFGGGGLLLAFGIACGVIEASRSGAGQVVDAAMVDGAAAMMAFFHGLHAAGTFDGEHRGANLIDSGAPYYDVYECADGEYFAIGALEPQFYAELIQVLGVAEEAVFARQRDRATWPAMRRRLAEVFHSRTRDEWEAEFAGRDACGAPVLRLTEAPQHPHHLHRDTFVAYEGVVQPAPAPRFSRTPGAIQRVSSAPGAHTDEVLAEAGFDAAETAQLRAAGVVR